MAQIADPWDPAAFGLTPAQPATLPPSVIATPSAGDGDPWAPEKFGLAPAAQTSPSQSAAQLPAPAKPDGVVLNVAAGANQGLASLLGAPMEASNAIRNLAVRGINAVAGTSIPLTDTIGGASDVKRAFGTIGANPDDVAATTPLQQAVRSGAEGATMALAPEAGGAALIGTGLASAARVAPAVERLGAITPGNVATGAASGIGSEVASSAAPDQWKPVAGALGGLAGGGLAALPAAGYQSARNALSGIAAGMGMGPRNALLDTAGIPIADRAGNALAVTNAQAQAAWAKIAGAASDPDTVRQALATPTITTLPQSPATTYQVTADQGLGSLERGISQRDPAPFIDIRNQQNAARVGALNSLTPDTANPADIGAAFRQQLTTSDATHQAAIDQARSGLDAAMGHLGGSTQGSDVASAQQQYGQQLRGQLDAANQAAKARESALWNAVDPDGTLTVDASPIQVAAQQVLRQHGQFATPLSGPENDILNLGVNAPQPMRFSDVKDYRSQITDAISQARQAGDNQTVRRLSQVLDGVHGALDGAVADKAASDAAAVQAGTMTPEQTMLHNLNQWAEAQRAGTAEAAVGAGVSYGQGAGAAAGGGASSDVGSLRTAGQAGRQAGYSPGNPSLPGQVQPVTPFDADAAARYAAARQATADRNATFTNAPGVGPVLAPGRWSGEFKMPDSQVLSALTSGAGSAERVRSYLAAGGDADALAGGLAFDLRRAAQNPDGTLDPSKLAAWQKTRSETLSALPDLQQRLGTAAGAQDALDQATAAQTANTQAFQSSAAGKFLGDADPVGQVGAILGSNTPQSQMRQLAQATSNDPAARAGLQRAVVEHILTNMQGDKQAGQTGTTQLYGAQLQKFVRQKGAALGEVMTPGQMQVLRDISADIQKSDQSVGGNVLGGGSQTTQNAAAMNGTSVGGTLLDHVRQHGIETLLGSGTGAAIGGSAGGALFGVPGAMVGGSIGGGVGTLAGKVASSLKAANISTVDGLVKEAMLNPALARTLLSRVTPQTTPNVGQALAATLRRSTATGAIAGAGQADRSGKRLPAPTYPTLPLNALSGAEPTRSTPLVNAMSGAR